MPRQAPGRGGGRGGGRLTHTPLRNDADPLWREIHQAADDQQAALSRALLAAFAALAARGVLLRLRAALRIGNVEQALQAVPVTTLLSLQAAVEQILAEVALTGARVGLEGELVVRLGASTGLPVAELAYWARTRAAGLVVGISEQTRQALRLTLAQALRDGLSPAKAAPLIEAVVGLNTVQAKALLARAAELTARGVPAGRAASRLATYAAQLRRQRARVIARHELLQAANAGRRAVWRRDVSNGLIAPDRWEREWVAIVPSDGRTCPYCEGQDGQRAPITGTYPDGSSGPPGHVLCRCTEVLRRVT